MKRFSKFAVLVPITSLISMLATNNINSAFKVFGIIWGVVFALLVLAFILGFIVERRFYKKFFKAYAKNESDPTFRPKEIFDDERMDYDFFIKHGAFLEKEGFEVVDKVVAQMDRYTANAELFLNNQPAYVELYINKREGIIALLGQMLIDNSKRLVSKEFRDVHNQVRPPIFSFYTPFQNHTELTTTRFLVSGLRHVCTRNHRLIAHPYESMEYMLGKHRQAMREHNSSVRTDRFPQNYHRYENAMLERCVDDWIEAGFAKRVGYSKIKITLKGSIWAYKKAIKAFILEADASPYLSKKKTSTPEKSEAFTVLNSFFDTSYLSEPVPQNESSNSVEDMGSDIEYKSDDTLEKVQPIWARPLAEGTDDMSTFADFGYENETSSVESASRSNATSDDKDSDKANVPETVNSPYNSKYKNSAHEEKPSVVNVVVTIAFLMVTVFLSVYFAASIWEESQIDKWPQVQGTIEYSELKPSSASILLDRSPNQQEFDIRYIYEIDGQAYQGSKIYTYGNYASWGSNWSELLIKYGDAGNQVSVYYNAEEPSESVLEISGPRLELVIALILVALSSVRIFFILMKEIKKIKYLKKESMQTDRKKNPLDKNDTTWQGAVLTVVFILFFVVNLVVVGVSGVFEAIRIQTEEEDYISTRGEVVEFEYEVRRTAKRRGRGSGRVYYIHIIYEYEVDRQTFEGNVINRFFEEKWVNKSRLDQWETMYFVGNEVNVFYNPDQPEHPVLELVMLGDYISIPGMVMGGAMAVILIASLIGMIQKRRRKKYMNEH